MGAHALSTFEYTPLDIAHHQVIKKPSKGVAVLEKIQAITAYDFVI
jgi:hypothetical protein